MRINLRHLLLTACAAAMLTGVDMARPAPAGAQFAIPIPGFGGFRIPRGYSGEGGYGRRHHRDRSDDEEESSSRPRESESVLATLGGAPSSQDQNAVLKSVTASGVLGAVGSNADRSRLGKAFFIEEARDYTLKIKKIIERFKTEQQKARDSGRGDVTEHAIEQSLDKAVKSARLEIFESFVGENWTTERLRVLILDRVDAELGRLFDGNNRGNAPMQDLDTLIQHAADSIYRRIFEISELLAANQGSALFVQRLYQAHGGLMDDQLREVADRMITKAAKAAVGKFDGLLRRDENGYALRYRAQRIVFDCLSENVEKISSSETGIATIGEIEQKIASTTAAECAVWLDNQFGAQADKITPQKPMPLRAIWSATGPKDNPSMYSGTGAL